VSVLPWAGDVSGNSGFRARHCHRHIDADRSEFVVIRASVARLLVQTRVDGDSLSRRKK